jgi:uncharacterized protein
VSDYRDHIREYIRRRARPIEKLGHQPRLYSLTREIGKNHVYDDDVVFAAAWLHDLGVFTGHRPEDPQALAVWDNTAYAMAKAPQILADVGFPLAKRAAVVEAIRTHQPASAPITLEGDILRDADILEQLGAIGIMRTVCKIGRDTRFPDFTSSAASLRKALTNLPKEIRLDSARALAQPRISFLEMFLSRLDAEAGMDLG